MTQLPHHTTPTRLRNIRASLAGAVALGALWAAAPGMASSTPPITSDGVIVEVAPGTSAAQRRVIAARLGAERIEDLGGSGLYLFDGVDPTTRGAARADLVGVPGIDGVSLDLPARAVGEPNDPCFATGRGCAISGGHQQDMSLINLPAVLGWVSVFTPVTVAVIDTSIGLDHPDLKNRLWVNPRETANGVDDDNNGFVDDIHGADWIGSDGDPNDVTGGGVHGTHVAGTIAAETNNGIGIAGIAPRARIMSLRFLGDNSGGTTADGIKAINYAVANGAKVINNSWVGWSTVRGYDGVCTAVRNALSAGVTVVSAAGNDGIDVESGKLYGTTRYWPVPASCYDTDVNGSPTARAGNGNGQITVAATDNADAWASFSNWGSEGSVDMSAPGVSILSTVTNLNGAGQRQHTYGWMSGTSMAAPHVAGAAALILGERPALSAAAVRAAVIDGGASTGSLVGRTASARRLDLAGSLRLVGVNAPDTSPPVMGQLIGPGAGIVLATRSVGFSWQPATDSFPLTYDLYVNNSRIASGMTTTNASATLVDGTHTWFVRARDSQGNSADSDTRTVTIDTTAPVAPSLISPLPYLYSTSVSRLQWGAASDAGSGIGGYEVYLNGVRVASAGASVTEISLPPLTAGEHSWWVTAIDRAGNRTDSSVRSFTIVTPTVPSDPGGDPVSPEPPTVTVPMPSMPVAPAPTPSVFAPRTGAAPFSVAINSNAPHARSRTVTLTMGLPDGASRMRWATSPGGLATAAWQPIMPTIAIRLTGSARRAEHRVHVQAADANGTVLGEAVDTIIVDTAPPRARITPGGAGYRLQARDDGGRIEYQVRGRAWKTLRASTSVPSITRGVRFRDVAGNVTRWITRPGGSFGQK